MIEESAGTSSPPGVDAGSGVAFRPAVRPGRPSVRHYPSFEPRTETLPTGYVHVDGALPLPCEILAERDVAVGLRDGTTIYTDVLRPVNGTDLPAIVAWSPYGKQSGTANWNRIPDRGGVWQSVVSGLEEFEGPDPAYWCAHGYAVVQPDPRGVAGSEGDIYVWGHAEASDGYDVVEWVASREWSNGKVGLSGNSWLAIIQWFIAAERPPHLAAIAPWEGIVDAYRDDVLRGGIPAAGFNDHILSGLVGKGLVEDVPEMVRRQPLMAPYWHDKAARLEQIEVPAYVVASFTNPLHSRGTLEGFRRIGSADKWLRVHNTHEWVDYNTPRCRDELRAFFDRYLRGLDNGWGSTPRVRVSVLDPGHWDVVERVEDAWPPSRVRGERLYLDASVGSLAPHATATRATACYRSDDGVGEVAFTIVFDRERELIGYPTLHCWVESPSAEDMDLFVELQKLDREGRKLTIEGRPPFAGPSGRLRVSHRELDPARSTETQPVLSHRVEQALSKGEVVPVDISIWPIGMIFHPGEQLRLVISGTPPPTPPGIMPVRTRNEGDHIIHTGGDYESYLVVPVVST